MWPAVKLCHLQEHNWHTGRVYRRGSDGCETHKHTHTPDASHASSLRAKLASLQLTGNNLSFGFQLPGQTFELQLLETEKVRERGRGRECVKTICLFIYCHVYSHAEHYFGSSVTDTFLIVVKWTLQSVMGKQARYHCFCQFHTASYSLRRVWYVTKLRHQTKGWNTWSLGLNFPWHIICDLTLYGFAVTMWWLIRREGQKIKIC